MKIGIIVHSKTGHTYAVAERLQKQLQAAGHSATLEKVIPVNDGEAEVTKVLLRSIPNAMGYDAYVFGCPVRGFSVSPILAAYLDKQKDLQGKKVLCLVTQSFPFPWMGGNRAIAQMEKICTNKGAQVCGTGIVNWSKRRRETLISTVVDNLSKSLAGEGE